MTDRMMTPEKHKERHAELHKALDELVADFIGHTGRLPSKTTVMEFMEWAYQQSVSPTEVGHPEKVARPAEVARIANELQRLATALERLR